jgi:outer membrane cobalamin receptor
MPAYPKSIASFVALFCLLFAATSLESANDLSISGTVLDPAGSRISGAVVNLYSSTSLVRTTRSGGDGSFSFTNLPSGAYVLECAQDGFQKHSRRLVLADASEVAELRLEVGGVHQHVSVVASDLPEVPSEIAKSVALISAEEIASRDLIFLTDALSAIPALQVQQLGGPGQLAAFRFRGLRPEDTAILLDGFRFQDPSENKGGSRSFLSNLLVTDAERIEVLRGAGSTLYGTNAIGGLINVVSRRPSQPFAGFVSAEGGSLGLFQSTGGLEGLAAGKRLSYSFQAAHVNYTRGQDDHDTYRDTGGTARFAYDLAPQVQLFGKFSLTDSFAFLNEDPFPGTGLAPLPSGQLVRKAIPFPEPGATFYPQLDDPDAHHADRIVSGAARLDHRVNRVWAHSLAYQSLRTRRLYDDGPALSPLAISLGNIDSPVTVLRDYDSTLDEIVWRNTFEVAGNDSLHFALGWGRSSLDQTEFGQTTQAAQKSFTIQLRNATRLLDGRLQLQIAGQAQYYRLDSPQFSDSTGNPYRSVADLDIPATYNGDVALAYFLAGSGTKVRLHAGNGYRAPSLYERFGSAGSGFYLGYPQLRPERAAFVDGGIDQFFLRDKLQASATYFFTRLQTTIEFVPTVADPFGRFFGYLNDKGGNARGVELSITARPSSLLNVSASYTHTNSDQRLPTSSGTTRFLGLSDHQFTLGLNVRPLRRLNLHLQTYAVSDHDFPLFGSEFPFSFGYRFPGFVRQDLTASYLLYDTERARLRLLARVDNLLNQEYYHGGFLAPKAVLRAGLRFDF